MAYWDLPAEYHFRLHLHGVQEPLTQGKRSAILAAHMKIWRCWPQVHNPLKIQSLLQNYCIWKDLFNNLDFEVKMSEFLHHRGSTHPSRSLCSITSKLGEDLKAGWRHAGDTAGLGKHWWGARWIVLVRNLLRASFAGAAIPVTQTVLKDRARNVIALGGLRQLWDCSGLARQMWFELDWLEDDE